MQAWLVTSYELVSELLLDSRLSSNINLCGLLSDDDQRELSSLKRFYERWPVFSDAPHQTRVREVLRAAFTRSAVQQYARGLKRAAGLLADAIASEGGGDFVHAFARPFAAAATGLLLGVPESDSPSMLQWTDLLIGFISTGQPRIEAGRQAQSATKCMAEYLREMVATHSEAGRSEVFEVMVQSLRAELLTESEFLAAFAQLMTGGISPVAHVLGTGLYGLLSQPGEIARLRSNQQLLPAAGEEMLRYDAPFQLAPRVALCDLPLHESTVQEGQRILLVLGSANRDAAQFPQPDTIDIGRIVNRHLTFGAGSHYCLGAMLVRLELQTALTVILDRLGELQLAGGTTRAPFFGVAMLEHLPLHVTAARR